MIKERDHLLKVVIVLFEDCTNGIYKGSFIFTEEYLNNGYVIRYIHVSNNRTFLI